MVSDAIKSTQNQIYDVIKGWIDDDERAKQKIHLQML
jgi:hypothetical protein